MTWTFDPPTYHCHRHTGVDLTEAVMSKALAGATVVVGPGVAETAIKINPGPFIVTVECPGAGAEPEAHDEPASGSFA